LEASGECVVIVKDSRAYYKLACLGGSGAI
jgi:hypothetical protein